MMKSWLRPKGIELVCQYLHDPLVLNTLKTELNRKSGVYTFVCLSTNEYYVGSAKNLSKRLSEHLNGDRSNVRLQKCIRKHGISNFVFLVLEFTPIEKLIIREQFYIDKLNPAYNILMEAGSSLGYKHKPETIEKISGPNNTNYGKP